MRIGGTRLLRLRKINEQIRLNIKSVAINQIRTDPVSLRLVSKIGMCKIKKRTLAKNDEVYAFPDSSYRRLRTNPRETTSSQKAVKRAMTIARTNDCAVALESVSPNENVPNFP